MVDSTRTWTLEQNDRHRTFATGPEASLFAESGPFAVTRHRHRHPAWKLVLPTSGHAVRRLLVALGPVDPARSRPT
ncbi:hypothetical protein [Streptomyces luteolus]|uniref:Uncharacterized protein n=1 Tax=Streptomyces luteolus TaxID=3043615 RepID=A0ABT6T727_9ACTN|nr:hypothetical protein [Streptomyces sp. B-S-A12]MDI3423675.1 hypothetical protein [Streptomyces sp. B-S-A12]